MEGSGLELRLRATRQSPADESRAALIVDRWAARRPVSGEGPEWRVDYPAPDARKAMTLCEADLTAIDPGWVEVLDFEAVPSKPLPEPEFS